MSKGLLSDLLKDSLSSGGEYADIYIEETSCLTIQLEDGRVEKIVSGSDSGIGVRVIYGGKSAYAYGNDFSDNSLFELSGAVKSAVRQGDIAYPAISLMKVSPSSDIIVKLRPDKIGMDKKVALLRDAERAARRVSNKVSQARLVYKDSIQNVTIVSSEGMIKSDERIHTLALVQVVASDGKILQTGYEPVGGFKGFELFNEVSLSDIAARTSEKAVRMLGARRAPGGRMPVVISSEAGGTMIHEAVGHGLEADLVQQGLSVYAGKRGEMIASPLITIIDDSSLPGMRGSFRCDDEGVDSGRTLLVEKGVLKGYMYDRLTSIKEGTRSTGNGRRESYRSRPIPRMSNTFIASGEDDPSGIVRSVDNGLFVKRMGGGQVNTVTGEFVFEVSEGYLIKKGVVCEPVRGATLIGNGPLILKSIDMVGNDLDFAIGTCGKDGQGVPVSDAMPTVRIPEMVIGGQV
ncbi:MAG: TldD/PmbA family protein [Nitrospirae bacterium]|nr:TldD/PmbA family protein [Nitrospirota bacterium]